MLKISHLKQYLPTLAAAIPEVKRHEMAVTKDDIVKFMKSHEEGDNMLLIAIVPEHGVSGGENSAKWTNSGGFFVLEKTDYSELEDGGYLNIFERVQEVVEKLINKLLEDKAAVAGPMCGFLADLEEESIAASPIEALESCNGYFVSFSMGSRF